MENAIIIGYGKLGSHLYRSLNKTKGIRIIGLIKNSKQPISKKLVNNANLIFITTQDSKIKNVVKKLSGFDLSKKIIFHSSGSLTSDELIPLSLKGAVTGSFHPVQTFESRAMKDERRFRNIYIAIEGNSRAAQTGKQIAKKLRAKPVILTKESKPLHHVCCVIASNFMASLVRQIEYLGAEINGTVNFKKIQNNGFNNSSFFNIYKPLAMQTLNNISAKGAVKSLTGPIERNDLETISSHLKNLPKEFMPMYIFMGIETVKLSLEKKSIKPAQAKKILKTFDKYLKIK